MKTALIIAAVLATLAAVAGPDLLDAVVTWAVTDAMTGGR